MHKEPEPTKGRKSTAFCITEVLAGVLLNVVNVGQVLSIFPVQKEGKRGRGRGKRRGGGGVLMANC